MWLRLDFGCSHDASIYFTLASCICQQRCQNTGGGGRFGGPGGAELTGANPAGGGGGGGVDAAGAGGGGMPAGGLNVAGLLNDDTIPLVLGEPPPTGVGADLLAASMALPRSSLSSPANMIPDSVPVKNVAMGIMSSKNLLSTGLIPFMGCVTNIRL